MSTLPWYARLALVRPRQIEENLERIEEAGIVEKTPNPWQVFLGVARMWYRTAVHPETIGATTRVPVRKNLRARLLNNRALRFPFLLREGSVVPMDLSGLASPPSVVRKHLLGTYHEGDGAIYDLRLLACYGGEMQTLRAELVEIIANDTPRSRMLRDLCVYEGYHEELLAMVDRVLAGDWSCEGREHTDASLEEYLNWCATRPETPAETWRALRRGGLGLDERSRAPNVAQAAPAETTPARSLGAVTS